jgi:3-oxoacyl-(acyl-carrier-protein) synthase
MRRRVVVTGLGCVSPVGNTVAESWANLLAGKSGIDTVTSFDVSNLSVKFAGEVKGFNVADYMPEKEARHMDRFIHLGLAAACQAVEDSGLPTGAALGDEIAGCDHRHCNQGRCQDRDERTHAVIGAGEALWLILQARQQRHRDLRERRDDLRQRHQH